jgi:hypothetical protein
VVKNYMELKAEEDAVCDSTYDTDQMTRTIQLSLNDTDDEVGSRGNRLDIA